MKNNGSDALQYSINEAAIFFFGPEAGEKFNAIEEIQVKIKDMTPTLMMGIGYFIAKGFLTYRGDQHYNRKGSGKLYYESLIKNGDINP